MRTKAKLIRKAALSSLFALCAASTATVYAQTATPATGLGQAWPNATDLSSNPNWHVYVFVLNGVKYIQVNDLNGVVHTAVGVANGNGTVLPVGVDSQNASATPVATSTTPVAPASANTQTVYSDSNTTVTATPQSDGTTTFSTLVATCPNGCSGGG
jgi:hypothetical protein